MADSGKFLAACKKEFVPIEGDLDELPISNLGALRMSLEALAMEDAKDTRSEQWWAKAFRLLASESEDDEGAGAEGVIQVNDDFCLSEIGGFGYGGI